MAVLGVIILIVVAVIAVTVVSQGGDSVSLDLPGFNIDTTAAGVFGVGAGCTLLGLLGVALLIGGARRGRRRRQEVKELRRDVDRQPGSATAEGHGGRTGTGTASDRVVEPADHEPRKPPSEGAGPGSSDGQRSMGMRGRDDGESEHFKAVPRD